MIEDDYDAEFRYDRRPLAALQGLDPARVAYVGTASKTLAPALRLGWILAPAALAPALAAEKLAADSGSPALDQLALAHLIASGEHDRHLRRVRRAYAERRDRLVAALARALPGGPDRGRRRGRAPRARAARRARPGAAARGDRRARRRRRTSVRAVARRGTGRPDRGRDAAGARATAGSRRARASSRRSRGWRPRCASALRLTVARRAATACYARRRTRGTLGAPRMSIAPSPTAGRRSRRARARLRAALPGPARRARRAVRRGLRPHRALAARDAPPTLRNGDAGAGAALVELVHGLPQEDVEPCIRACALQLQLANIAEERERVRRRRHYDATGVRQRESLMEAADLLRDDGRRPRRRAALAARRARAHRAPDRGDPPLRARPPARTSRGCSTRLDDPRIGRSRRRALLAELREALTIWWQTDEVRRVRPMVEDEVRRNLFFFEATLYDAVPEVLEELERCFDVRVDGARAGVRLVGRLGHGRPPGGRRRDARAHARAAPRDRAAAAARAASTGSRGASRTPRRRVPVSPALEASLERDAPELPSARVLRRANREYEPLRTKLGFITHRLLEHARPARARARLQRPAGAARRPLARARQRRLRARRARRACGGCCGRSTCSASTSPSLDVRQSAVGRAGGGRRRCCPATATPTRTSGCGCSRRRSPSSRRGLGRRPEGAGGRAAARARHGRARARGLRQARGAGDGASRWSQSPSDVLAALWLARRAGAQLRLAPLFETLADLRARAGDDGRRSTTRRSTATRCAPTATAS